MRRSRLAGLVIAGILVAALLIGTGVFAYADGQGSGATVDKDMPCVLLGSDSGLGTDLWTDEMSINVGTPAGTTTLICHFDIPEGYEPEKAIRNTSFTCSTLQGMTMDSMSVVTPGGKAVLTCKINPSQ